jgi:cell division transport system permease protein
MRLRLVLTEMLIGLRRNVILTLAVIITVMVSLVLVGAALMLNRQVDRMKGYWYDKVEVTVSLCTSSDTASPCNGHPVTDAQRRQISQQIAALPQVKTQFYESEQEALAHFKEQFADTPSLVAAAEQNGLPDSFRVKLRDPNRSDIVISALTGTPGVEEVVDQRKLIAPLFKLLHAFQTIALYTAVGVLLAAIALIVNTIRIAVFSRRREIGIMRLVGASNLYIELPFLLEGAFAGLIGGVFAFAGVQGIESLLVHGQLKPALAFNQRAFVTNGDTHWIGLELMLLGVLMSTVVAFLTLTFSRATRV